MKSNKRNFPAKENKRIVKHRNRLEGQIKAQAAVSTGKALELAQHGRTLVPIEGMLKSYLLFKSGKLGQELRANLGEALLSAVDNQDAETFRVMAKAIDNQANATNAKTFDALRANLLAMKGVLTDCGTKMTIQRLAQLLGVEKSDDGFSNLRQICKGLGFPIKAAKRGRKRSAEIKQNKRGPLP